MNIDIDLLQKKNEDQETVYALFCICISKSFEPNLDRTWFC